MKGPDPFLFLYNNLKSSFFDNRLHAMGSLHFVSRLIKRLFKNSYIGIWVSEGLVLGCTWNMWVVRGLNFVNLSKSGNNRSKMSRNRSKPRPNLSIPPVNRSKMTHYLSTFQLKGKLHYHRIPPASARTLPTPAKKKRLHQSVSTHLIAYIDLPASAYPPLFWHGRSLFLHRFL